MRLWLLCMLAFACGGSNPGSVAGTWNSTGGIPGTGIRMTLAQSGSAVSGSGTQQVEAGSPRTFTVEGSSSGDQVSLGIDFSDQSTATFQATLADDTLTGTWTPQAGNAAPVTFTR